MARSGLNNIISHDSATLQQLTSGKNRNPFSPSTPGSSKRTSSSKTGRRYRFRVRVRKACISLTKKAKAFSNFLKPNKRLTNTPHSWMATDIRIPTISSHTRSSTPSICVTRPTLRLHQVPPSPVPSQTSSSRRRKNNRKSMRFSHPVVNAVIAGPARTPEPSVATALTTDSWSTVNTADLSGTAPGTPNTVTTADFQGQVNPKRVFRESHVNASFNTFKDVMDGVKAKPKPMPLPAQASAHAEASTHASAYARTRARAEARAEARAQARAQASAHARANTPALAPAPASSQTQVQFQAPAPAQSRASAHAPAHTNAHAPIPATTQVHAQVPAPPQIPTPAPSASPPSLPYIAAQPPMTLNNSNNDPLAAFAARVQAQYVLPANGTAPAVIVIAHPSVLQPGFQQPQQQQQQPSQPARPHTIGNFLPYIPYNPRFNPYNAPSPNSPSPTLPPTPTTGLPAAIAEADSAEEQIARKRHTTLYADVESGCIFPPPSPAPGSAPVIATPPTPAPAPVLAPAPVHTIKRKPVPARSTPPAPAPAPANTSKPLPPIPGPSDPRRFTGGIVPESIRMNSNGYPMIGKGKGKGKGWAADVGEVERERERTRTQQVGKGKGKSKGKGWAAEVGEVERERLQLRELAI